MTIEYKELSVDVAAVLKERKQCKGEVVAAVVQGALSLLNHRTAIQQKASLDTSKANKYQVSFPEAKYGEVECTVNKCFVSCRCPSFKFDSVCKHFIALAEKVGILDQHLQYIPKASKIAKASPRSILAKANVDKEVAGKKGACNKNPYRPSRLQENQTIGSATGQHPPQSAQTTSIKESITGITHSFCAFFQKKHEIANIAKLISVTE